jgi:hypothetical protein
VRCAVLVYFSLYDIVVNTATMTYAKTISKTDQYLEPHVIVKFDGGDFVEFPPGITLYEVYTTLNERSADD